MKKVKKIAPLLYLTLLLSCTGSYTGKELQEWLSQKENGLIQTVENEKFKIEVQYKPTEYMVAQETKERLITKEELETKKKEKEGLQYFNIKLLSKTGKPVLKTDLESEAEENLRLQYYIGGFEYDIFLADGKDTLPCILYHFERTYGALPFNNISVAFENVNNDKKDKQLLIIDRALGLGLQKIEFKKEDLYKIPVLKTK